MPKTQFSVTAATEGAIQETAKLVHVLRPLDERLRHVVKVPLRNPTNILAVFLCQRRDRQVGFGKVHALAAREPPANDDAAGELVRR